jgi:hypothetical protein
MGNGDMGLYFGQIFKTLFEHHKNPPSPLFQRGRKTLSTVSQVRSDKAARRYDKEKGAVLAHNPSSRLKSSTTIS